MAFEIKIISDNTNEVEYEAFYEKIKKLTYEFHKDKIQRIWLETSFKSEPVKEVKERIPFDHVYLSRSSAEEVLDRLNEIIGAYGSTSIMDLKNLLQMSMGPYDGTRGWKSMHGAQIRRVQGGYIIDFPGVVIV